MHCNICQRPCNTRLPFNCAGCARDVLYHTRFRLAHTLLEHEAASSQVEHSLEVSREALKQSASNPSTGTNPYDAAFTLESLKVERIGLQARIQTSHEFADDLRADMSKIKESIRNRRTSNEKRKADLAAARQELARQEAQNIGPTLKTIGRIRSRWDMLHIRTAESRLLLCKEAASLYGLQKLKKRDAKSKMDIYAVGGLPIYNLRDLNNANPANVTTVNTILAHLVHLLSHYLSLRLPAEITLPHRDYPLPTILPPTSSYTGLTSPFPTSTPANSSSNSPTASKALHANQTPKPRPLFLRKQLALTAKEDPQTCTAFVEGATLLAWNIAWLCKTQGIGVGDDSWDEVCAVGKNLWKLVTAQPTASRVASTSHDRRTKQDPDTHPPPSHTAPKANSQPKTPETPPVTFGHFSHGTVHSDLTSAAGTDYMRRWRLQDSRKVVDRMQQVLLSDRTGAGWEILEGKEWEEIERAGYEDTAPAPVVDASTVVVSSDGVTLNDAGKDPKSISKEQFTDSAQDRARGTSGWTKLKSR
ncbi:MAG: hypothetical protein Q9219_002019 [cf. Caloplaca sp. 3 TL-2023]